MRITSILASLCALLSAACHTIYADIGAVAGVAAVAYIVVDPLAPNWEISETRYSDTKVAFVLTKKDFHVGGTGEASWVLKRRLDALSRERGGTGYQIVRYEEGIESRIWLPRRFVHAEATFE